MFQLSDIKPITLLNGHHKDTAKTGQGCFMDVIAYLNGESYITDDSPCVCQTVRPIARTLNDIVDKDRRQAMLPYMLRAMGSATTDRVLLGRRVDSMVQFGHTVNSIALSAFSKIYSEFDYHEFGAYDLRARQNRVQDIGSKMLKSYDYMMEDAAEWLNSEKPELFALKNTSVGAANVLYNANELLRSSRTGYFYRKRIIELTFKYLDDVLPPAAEPDNVVIARARQLAEMSA